MEAPPGESMAPVSAPFPDFTAIAFAQGNAAAQALFAEVQTLKHKVASLERWKGQSINDMKNMQNEIKRLTSLTGGNVGPATKAEKEGGAKMEATKKGSPDGGFRLPAPEPLMRAQSTPDPMLPPPGLALPLAPDLNRAASALPLEPPAMIRGTSDPDPGPESLKTELVMVNDVYVPHVEWRIENVRMKLRSCAGKPLVSPPFDAKGLANLRLMVFPGLDHGRGLRTREQKSKYESMINAGPLNGALKFKVTSAGSHSVLTFNLCVGEVKKGPMTHNFAEHVVQGCDDFGINWLDQIEPNGSLCVGVELLDVKAPKAS